MSKGEEIAETLPSPTTPVTEPILGPVDSARYMIGDEIARGGMGRILAGHDRRLRRALAVKQLTGGDSQRFEREALITARLQHPNIVPVYEAGQLPTGPFYAMKLVKGRSLDVVVREQQNLEQRLGLLPNVIAVVEALAYAHEQRVIHRDLKPANVLVGDFGETVVIDWGLAKDLSVDEPEPRAGSRDQFDAGSNGTVAGSVMGTPAYMPPEQARGETVDERADVYALGALLYHVLVGASPYQGRTADEILDKVLAGPPRPLAERVPEAPRDLVTIVDKAMARSPAARFPSARELAADLRRFETGQLVGVHEYTIRELVRRWVRRHRAAVMVGSIGFAIIVIAGVFAIREVSGERDRTAAATDERDQVLATLAQERRETEQRRTQIATARVDLERRKQQGSDTSADEQVLVARERQLDRDQGEIAAKIDKLLADSTLVLGSSAPPRDLIVKREQSIAAREKDFIRRESGIAAREQGLEEREKTLSRREADLKSSSPVIIVQTGGSGGTTIIQPATPPKQSRLTRADFEPVYARARRHMNEKGLVADDLGAIATVDLEELADRDLAAAITGAKQLEQTIEMTKIDRQFLAAKFNRISTKARGKPNSAATNKLFSEATEAYSNGNFVSANQKLNQISSGL